MPLLFKVNLLACEAKMELISDKTGSMAFGWLAPDVYYMRVSGDISPQLAATQLMRVEVALENRAQIHFFSDCAEVKSYDLLARSAFARFLLTHRKRFAEIVVLASAEGRSTDGQALASAVGEPLVLLVSASDFMKRLDSRAPGLSQFLASPPRGSAPRDQTTVARAK
jgi:hypothetical protein